MYRKIDLPVTGMTCAACSAAVEKVLKGIYGVLDVTVNPEAEKENIIGVR